MLGSIIGNCKSLIFAASFMMLSRVRSLAACLSACTIAMALLQQLTSAFAPAIAFFGEVAVSSLRETLAVRTNAAGNVADEAELRFLLGDGHRVGIFTRREPALRAERKPFQRHDVGRFADAPLHRGRVLQPPVVGGDAPKHDVGIGPYMLEWRQVTRARAIVFEQQCVLVAQARIKPVRNRLIAAVREPAPARRVAAAQMDGARYSGDALEHPIVDLGVLDQLLIHVVTPRLERGANLRIGVPLRSEEHTSELQSLRHL